jgi:hypothetical protein
MSRGIQDQTPQDDFDPSNLLELAQMASLFGAEMRNIETNYTEKPSTGSGVEFDVRNLIHQEKLSINQNNPQFSHSPVIQTENFLTPNKGATIPGFQPPVRPNPSVNVDRVEMVNLQEDLKAIKEILNRINNNLSKISGMAGKIFSNLNLK